MTVTPVAELDPKTAKAWIDSGDTVMLDVREPGEHAREHIEAARLAPLSSFDPATVDLGSAKRVLVVCASGMRSARAATQLAAARGLPVANLKGGLNAWKAAGLPVRANAAAPLPIMRQVQIAAGSLALIGVVLGFAVHPAFFLLSGAVGAGLMFAGLSGTCMMANLLMLLPYNKSQRA